MPGAEQYRYRDTAVAHLTSTLNQDFMEDKQGSRRRQWDVGAAKALEWYETAPGPSIGGWRVGCLGYEAGSELGRWTILPDRAKLPNYYYH